MSIRESHILLRYYLLLLAAVQCTPAINNLLLPELPRPATKIINVPYILKVIDTINHLKKIESYTLVVTNLLDSWNEDDVSLLRQRVEPHISIYNSQLQISKTLNLNSVTIVFAKSSEDSVLLKVSEILRNLKLSVVMVVITSVLPTDKAIMLTVSQIMVTLAEANMINSMVIYDNNVFNFELYPSLKIFNMSGKENLMNLNAEKVINFQGYHIRTPIKKDLPRVFRAPGSRTVRGMTGWFFQLYCSFSFVRPLTCR